MWLVRVKWVVLWSLWAGGLVPQPTAPVRVRSGWLRGLVAPAGTHAQYTAIPYAKVQTRFEAAKPVPKWDGIYDAFDEHIRCTQRFSFGIFGTEDCLTLNLYTPLPAAPHLLPVMVFIHGGGFRDGSGTPLLYGPEFLVKHGVILISINYRVEVLGFLCLGTKDAPGNVGLKDQVEALRWIQENIKAFGGDPSNISIFGESAGSASVLYHVISPMSKGLFHKAIMQSGSAISPWSIQFDPLMTASLLAKRMGHNTDDPSIILNIFKNTAAEELLKTRVQRNEGDVVLSENIFVPCIEKVLPNEEHFLLDSPYNLIASGNFNKVPVIIGYNDAEGFMFVGKENKTTIAKFNVYNALPRDLIFPTNEEKKQTAEFLQEHYNIGDKNKKENMVQFAKYQGDSGIVYPVVSTIELLLKANDRPVYGYKFCYDGWLNLAKITYGFGKYPGATHADELFYLFKTRATLPFSFLDADFIHFLTTLWTNFAKYGDPTPADISSVPVKWKPLRINQTKLYVLNKNCSEIDLWDDDIIQYWNRTYSKYRRRY